MKDGTSIDGSGSTDKRAAVQEIVNDLIARQSHDPSCDFEHLTAAHPELMPELGQELREFQIMRAAWQSAGEETLPLERFVSFANGRYQLQSLLGEGGQKRVFLARDNELDRDVVIGVLNRRRIESDSLGRLRGEAKAMARLDEHPNVVSVFDIGEEEGNPFIVTQYVRGGSVADVLSACRPAPLELPEAIRIASQTCRALDHAHAHGILHRDVKPTNVWLMRDGTVKLGDFGLALSLDQTELTDEDMRVGCAPIFWLWYRLAVRITAEIAHRRAPRVPTPAAFAPART